jgi:hypothetical protein
LDARSHFGSHQWDNACAKLVTIEVGRGVPTAPVRILIFDAARWGHRALPFSKDLGPKILAFSCPIFFGPGHL